jgi:hypothetical protein
MKLTIDQILKPGVTLTVSKIDFSDPKVKALMEETKQAQIRLRKLKEVSREHLMQVVNI